MFLFLTTMQQAIWRFWMMHPRLWGLSFLKHCYVCQTVHVRIKNSVAHRMKSWLYISIDEIQLDCQTFKKVIHSAHIISPTFDVSMQFRSSIHSNDKPFLCFTVVQDRMVEFGAENSRDIFLNNAVTYRKSSGASWKPKGNTTLPRSKEAITACSGRFNRCHNLSRKPKTVS